MTFSDSQTKPNSNSKPIIILIHGGASSSRMYNNVLPHLSQSYTVLTPDLPGHGTNTNSGPFTFAGAVTTITECITSATTTITKSDPSTPNSASNLRPKILLVGISLGGQSVLSFLRSRPDLVDAVLVSGVSIHPPDEHVNWEMPHMPSDQATISMMMEDVAIAGMENMAGLQKMSLGFTFDPAAEQGQQENGSAIAGFPPTLVMIGEHDMAMQRRDFEELVGICKGLNGRSEGVVLKGAWHNHSIDVPELFAEAVRAWAGKIL